MNRVEKQLMHIRKMNLDSLHRFALVLNAGHVARSFEESANYWVGRNGDKVVLFQAMAVQRAKVEKV